MARAYRLIKRSGERAVLLHSGDLKAGDAVRCGGAYGVVVKTAYTLVTEEVVYVLRHVPEAGLHTGAGGGGGRRGKNPGFKRPGPRRDYRRQALR